MKEAVAKEQMLIFCEGEKLLACGVVNHSMIPEYEMISWRVSEPKEKLQPYMRLQRMQRAGEKEFLQSSCRQFWSIAGKGRCSPAS